MRRWLLSLVAVASALGALAGSAAAGEGSLAGRGEATYQRKKDAMIARDEAFAAATADAVRKALTAFVSPEILREKSATIDQEVLASSVAFVERTEVVSETDRDGVYSVVLKVWVDDGALRTTLQALGFDQDVRSRRSIAVVIEEYFAGDAVPSTEPLVARELEVSSVEYKSSDALSAGSSHTVDADYDANVKGGLQVDGRDSVRVTSGPDSLKASSTLKASGEYRDTTTARYDEAASSHLEAHADESYSAFSLKLKENFPPTALRQPRSDPASGAAISARLLQRDCRLVDDSTVGRIRAELVGEDGLLLDLLANPARLSELSVRLGANYGADAFMIGTTAIVYNGERSGGHQATATLAVRIVDAITGDIVAYAVREQSGLGADSQSAAATAARRLGDLLGQDLGDQLFAYWKRRDEKGIEITLRVLGVDSTRLNLILQDTLSGISGVVNPTQRIFDRPAGLSEFVLTTQRPPAELKAAVLRALFALPDFEKLEEELAVGSEWVFRIP